ncbi:hypothetical protein [Streptomonospora sediminis]
MSMTRTMTKRMWLVGTVLLVAAAAFAAMAFITIPNWYMPVILTVVQCIGLVSIFRVHLRPEQASDSQRATLGGFLDERDRELTKGAFAIVGAVALPFSVVAAYAALLFDADAQTFVTAQFLGLLLLYPVAVRYLARRR